MKVILKPRVHSNYLLVQFCENRALGLKQTIDSCVCGAFILFTFHWIHWSSSTFGCICRFDASRFEWMAQNNCSLGLNLSWRFFFLLRIHCIYSIFLLNHLSWQLISSGAYHIFTCDATWSLQMYPFRIEYLLRLLHGLLLSFYNKSTTIYHAPHS